MGAGATLRVLIDGLLAGEPFDLGVSAGVFKITPDSASTNPKIYLGSDDITCAFRVYLGAANKYFDLSANPATMSVSNVAAAFSTLNLQNLNTVDTIVSNLATVATLSMTTDNSPATSITVGGAATATLNITGTLSTGVANATTFNSSGIGSVVGNLNSATTANLTVAATTNVSTTQTSFTGNSPDFTGISASIIPAIDDTGSFIIGNTTAGIDFSVILGGASNTFKIDRGTQSITVQGINVDTDSSLTVNSTIVTDDTASALVVNTGPLNVTGKADYTGNGHMVRRIFDFTSNTTLTADHYGAIVTNKGASETIKFTLPDVSVAPADSVIELIDVIGHDRAAQFSGTTSGMHIDSTSVVAYPFTLVAWFKGTDAIGDFLWVGDKNSTAEYCGIGIAGTARPNAYSSSVADGFQRALGAASFDNNVYHQICGVFNSATSRRVYADAGTDDVTDATSVTIGAVYDRTSIGFRGDSSPSLYYANTVDHCMVFNISLNTGQMDWLYNTGSGRTYDDINTSVDAMNPGNTNLLRFYSCSRNHANGVGGEPAGNFHMTTIVNAADDVGIPAGKTENHITVAGAGANQLARAGDNADTTHIYEGGFVHTKYSRVNGGKWTAAPFGGSVINTVT